MPARPPKSRTELTSSSNPAYEEDPLPIPVGAGSRGDRSATLDRPKTQSASRSGTLDLPSKAARSATLDSRHSSASGSWSAAAYDHIDDRSSLSGGSVYERPVEDTPTYDKGSTPKEPMYEPLTYTDSGIGSLATQVRSVSQKGSRGSQGQGQGGQGRQGQGSQGQGGQASQGSRRSQTSQGSQGSQGTRAAMPPASQGARPSMPPSNGIETAPDTRRYTAWEVGGSNSRGGANLRSARPGSGVRDEDVEEQDA